MFKRVTRWHKISDGPGAFPNGIPVIRYVAGKKMCLVRTPKGLFAIEEKCPHNGFSLAQGQCSEDGEAIVCPLHRFGFDLKTGRSRSGAFGGAAMTWQVEEREDGIFIGVEETHWGWW